MQKKSYRGPELLEYGPLVALTLGQTSGEPDCGSQNNNDGAPGNQTPPCGSGGGSL
jgi:hypothetical protein